MFVIWVLTFYSFITFILFRDKDPAVINGSVEAANLYLNVYDFREQKTIQHLKLGEEYHLEVDIDDGGYVNLT